MKITKELLVFPNLLLALILVAQLSYAPISLLFTWAIILLLIIKRLASLQIKSLSKWVLISSIGICLVLIYTHFHSFLGVEAGVALLTSCLFAKCLESKTIRDLLITLNFGLFVSASLFLHSQSFLMSGLVVVCLLACFIGLYRIQTAPFTSHGFKQQSVSKDSLRIVRVIFIAIPLFVLLFIFFPRLPPLWHIPMPSHQGITGLSDHMSPGDIAQLSQSPTLAFRIIGNFSKLPTRQQLYWRAMVLDHYDGTQWTRSPINQTPLSTLPTTITPITYSYVSNDSTQLWITALDQSIPNQATLQNGQIYIDGSIQRPLSNTPQKTIQMNWLGSTSIKPNEVNLQRQIHYAEQNNFTSQPKTQALAQNLWQQSRQDPKAYIQAVLNWYQQQGFIYSLSPGLLTSPRQIDQFLFESKTGFCEHYAASFAVLMRYVGIPSRIILGYQGGQLAPDGKSWEVRQLDAHAWNEVYINGQWQRVDPTSVIAPNRLTIGMQDYLQQNQQVWGEDKTHFWQKQRFNLGKNLTIWNDYLSYQWQTYVVGYDTIRQNNLFTWLKLDNPIRVLFLIFTLALIATLIYFTWRYYQNYRRYTPAQCLIVQFQKKLLPSYKRHPQETVRAWLLRLSEFSSTPQPFMQATQLYEKIVFFEKYTPQDLLQLKQLLKVCASKMKHVEKTCQVKQN